MKRGSFDWGSSGRRFKSCQPDQDSRSSEAVSERSAAAFCIPPRGMDSNADSNGCSDVVDAELIGQAVDG